jgi:hypothetical protein
MLSMKYLAEKERRVYALSRMRAADKEIGGASHPMDSSLTSWRKWLA